MQRRNIFIIGTLVGILLLGTGLFFFVRHTKNTSTTETQTAQIQHEPNLAAQKTSELCESKSEDPVAKGDCYENIASANKDVELCTKISDQGQMERCRSFVTGLLAIQKKDVSLCETLSESEKALCEKKVLLSFANKTECDTILSENIKQTCLEIFLLKNAQSSADCAQFDTPEKRETCSLRFEALIQEGGESFDADKDGISDAEEKELYLTDPTKTDTDEDGLTDMQEIFVVHSDPLKADTDADGYSDGLEIQKGYNPLGPGIFSGT